jgi:hypothetical protein
MTQTPGRGMRPQLFPIYYPAEAQFLSDAGDAVASRGAVATLSFSITTRPFALVGVRLRNLYELPAEGVTFQVEGGSPPVRTFYPPELESYLARLDADQDVAVELAQQNIVIRPANQQLVQGADGIHWHPFACPFPFRGGNNVVVRARRRTAYPDAIGPVALQGLLVGWQYVSDADPGGHPPSSGFPPEGPGF